MYQCHFGDVCNEDWYHEECILGLPFPPAHKLHEQTNGEKLVMPPSPKGHPTKVVLDAQNEEDEEATSPSKAPLASEVSELGGDADKKKEPEAPKGHPTGINLLPELIGDIPGSAEDLQGNNTDDDEGDEHIPPPGFPDDNDFEAFICWKCVSKHRAFLGKWAGMKGVALDAVVRKQPEDQGAVIHTKDGVRSAADLKRHLEDSEAIASSPKRRASTEKDDLANSSLVSSTSSTISTITKSSASLSSIDENYEAGACKMPKIIPEDKEFSLFLCNDWREKICRCEECLKFLDRFPMLKDEEATYEPPQDEDESMCLL